MLGFDVPKQAFVATATAIALLVDGARMPVYFFLERDAVLKLWPSILLASAGVIIGTIIGKRILVEIPERWFRRTVAVLLAALGLVMLVRAVAA